MPTQYFQGDTLYGPVRESIARSFADVVDAFRVCPTLPLTRQSFLTLPKSRRNEIKQVPFFVAACFSKSPSRRLYEHATTCNLIFLDIDETKDGKCPAAPFVRNPDSLDAALKQYNYAAYETASSTPEKPRMRVVVDAKKIPLHLYPQAVKTVAGLLGLPSITVESRVAVQPMYLPTQFQDSTNQDHPLINYRINGETFTVEDIDGEDSVDEYQEARATDYGADALHFLRAPVPEITLEVAKQALGKIDPDCPYFEWLEIAAALRHQFSPAQAEEAFELFDDWSSFGSKYEGEEDTRAKWDSLRPTPVGRLPVTIRTLLRRAMDAGWNGERVKENCFARVVDWMESVETATELMEKGVHKILALPMLSAVQENILVNLLVKQLKTRFAYTVSPSSFIKDINRIKTEIKNAEKPIEKLKEPSWAKGVCYVSQTNEFYRQRTGERYKVEAFNAIYGRELLPTEESLKDSGVKVTPATLATPVVQPSDFVLNHLKITTVYDYAYDPSRPGEIYFSNRGKRFVNIYSPTYPQPDYKKAEEAGKSYLRHLDNLIAEPEYRTIITDFLAFLVQHPGEKIRWAIMLQGAEGAGKTYFAKVAQAVLGFEHVKILGDGAIKSGYNEWSFGHQLVAVEEIYVSGANRHSIMNAIKPLITNDDISVDEKFRSNRQVHNVSNYMLFSNHHDALALTPNDRRYFVVKSALQHKQDVLQLGENYFSSIYGTLRDNPGGMRAWLLDWEISDKFQPNGHAPRTKYVQEMVQDSANDLTAAIRKLLLEGDYPLVQYDIVSATTLFHVLQVEEGLNRVSHQQIAAVLREEGFLQLGRYTIDSERHYLWIRNGVDSDTALDVAARRVKENMKNLCMELMFE